eukprot:7113867-Prymnesium_polylepis.1
MGSRLSPEGRLAPRCPDLYPHRTRSLSTYTSTPKTSPRRKPCKPATHHEARNLGSVRYPRVCTPLLQAVEARLAEAVRVAKASEAVAAEARAEAAGVALRQRGEAEETAETAETAAELK